MTEQEIANFIPTITYKVTVEKVTTFVESDDTKYEKIGTHQKDSEYNKIGDIEYGYVVKPPHVSTKKDTVFQQSSEKTDILALIAAVNGIEFK